MCNTTLSTRLCQGNGLDCLQGKVRLVADAVWSKLTGVFVNDVLHVQVGLSDCLTNAAPHINMLHMCVPITLILL